MLNNAHDIKPGSLIFYSFRYSVFSTLLQILTGFKYTKIALYLGNNEVLETSLFGRAKKSCFSRYINNPFIVGEVVTFLQDPIDVKWFINRVKKLLRQKNNILQALQKALSGLEIEMEKPGIKETFEKVCKK